MRKKYFESLLTLVLVAFLGIGLASCSKDDDKNDISLVGTTYACHTHFQYTIDGDEMTLGDVKSGNVNATLHNVYTVYNFTSSTKVITQMRRDSPTGEITGEATCSYTLDYPTIKISDGETTITGTFIDVNSFRVVLEGYSYVFQKQ